MAKGGSTGRRITALLLALPIIFVVGLWLLRGTIATGIAAGELERRGLVCDDRFSVSLSATLEEATIEPTRCTRPQGLIESVDLREGATIELSGTSPRAAVIPSLGVSLRGGEIAGGTGWAAELAQLGIEQRVAGLVKALSEAESMGLPPVTVNEAEVTHGRSVIASGRGLTLDNDDPRTFRATTLSFAASLGSLTLSEVTGEASSTAVSLAGRARATVGVAMFSASRTGRFSLTASDLQAARPSFSLRADF